MIKSHVTFNGKGPEYVQSVAGVLLRWLEFSYIRLFRSDIDHCEVLSVYRCTFTAIMSMYRCEYELSGCMVVVVVVYHS